MLSGSNAEKNNLLFSKFNSELLGNKNSFGLNPLYRHSCSYNSSTRLLDDEYTHKCMKTLPNEENNYKSCPSRTNLIDWCNELRDCADAFKKLCDDTWEEPLDDKELSRLKKDAFKKLYNIIDDLWF